MSKEIVYGLSRLDHGFYDHDLISVMTFNPFPRHIRQRLAGPQVLHGTEDFAGILGCVTYG
jgi:hypothetical protein